MTKMMSSSFSYLEKAHRKRPGVISKCRTSNNKQSKHYRKSYKGQGRA